ncbi:phosphatase PAP2 family protein [Stackebrandtia nassauensis]|uniref:Phosphoesterase PA-phosphatase related protein n=1 Tax=Stackebrandtia nassauensis (strain DSM 44728 / CIP 108903 / NRRL B-16338 / NBRC 102104 / LLR-40K-21) TaxID=446470 RepID=D3Q438_STANL|nr:phosphatase PAP2 family protein [Stackebrandtia nassauensis]ADD45923.1 phosphoesterase PA-phosphatase related protein [Stackebrandtia nassauensis DSM 44728]
MSEWRVYGGAPRRWWPDLALLLGFVGLTALLLWPSPLVSLDVAVRDAGQAALSPVPYWIARGLTYLGQGLPLSIGCGIIAVLVARRHRSWRPVLLFASVYVGLAVVLGLKQWFDRIPPRWPDPGNPPYVDAVGAVLFGGDGGVSYPSGHLANTAVWYGLAIALVGERLSRRNRLLLLTAPPLIVLVAQTYLGFHWLSDQPAGYVLGLLIVRGARRVFTYVEVRRRRRVSRARRNRLTNAGSAASAAGLSSSSDNSS